MPRSAKATCLDEEAVYELEGSADARAKWDNAVERALKENSPIFYGIKGEHPSNTDLQPYAAVRTVSAAKSHFVDTKATLVTISANYGTTTANKISPFNWAKIYNNILTYKDSHYDRAILDGGRTSAIFFHAVFTTPWDIGTWVGDFYAEFYYTFKGVIY